MTDRFVGYMWNADRGEPCTSPDDGANRAIAHAIFGTPPDGRTLFSEAATPEYRGWWFWLALEVLFPPRQVLCVWRRSDD